MPLFVSRRRLARLTADAAADAVEKARQKASAGVLIDSNPMAQYAALARPDGWTPPPDDVQEAMTAEGMDPARSFSPGLPIQPYEGYQTPPRAFNFATGTNIVSRPRTNRVSFDTLYAIIHSYDVARMCVQHRIDDIRSLGWSVVADDTVESNVDEAVAAARKAMAKPDGRTAFGGWLATYLEDILCYDAGTLYRRRDRAGRVIGLDVVDGRTIAPLLDYYGRRPAAPAPAFSQFANGVPWVWLNADDVIYEPFRPQPDSPYGLPPMESILLNANTDLRFQWFFLQRFTEGTVPAGFMEAPPDVTQPDQVKEFQDIWDAMMQGDQARKQQIRWVPAGAKYTAAREDTFEEAFSLFLMRKTAAAFGVTPNDLGFTDDVNRSTGETQVDVQFRISTLPLVQHLEGIFTGYLQNDLGLPVKFAFDTGQEKDDRVEEAQAWKIYIESGMASADEGRAELLGLPVDPTRPVPRFILTARGGPVPLAAIMAVSGEVDPHTAAPAEGAVLPAEAFTPVEGVIPSATSSAPALQPGAGTEDMPAGGGAAPAKADLPMVDGGAAGAATAAASVKKADVGPVAAGLAVRAADTGRVLMLQRSIADDTDPAAGTWEFPGGHLEPGEEPFDAACREWTEETGATLPDGVAAGSWVSPNGVYQGFVYVVAAEADVMLSLDADGREVLNPDDPDGDDIETACWWNVHDLMGMPGLRRECRTTDWQLLSAALPAAVAKDATAGVTAETGITGVDLADDDDDEDEDSAAAVAKELARWRQNTRSRLRKGQPPKRFASDVVPAATLEHVWSHLQHARTPAAVDAVFKAAAGGVSKATSSARMIEGGYRGKVIAADRRYRLAIEAHYAPKIAEQMAGMFDRDHVRATVEAFMAANPQVDGGE